MRRLLFFGLVAVMTASAVTADAQGQRPVRREGAHTLFGTRVRQARAATKSAAARAAHSSDSAAPARPAARRRVGMPGALPALDQGVRVDAGEGVMWRYVYGYNAQGERASETVYRRQRDYSTGVWGAEERYDRGVYAYEYDTKGRVRRKSVTYEENHNDSYFVEADYGQTPTVYQQRSVVGSYEKDRDWACHADGTLAWERLYNGGKVYHYDEDGRLVKFGYSAYHYDSSTGGRWSDSPAFYITGAMNDETYMRQCDYGGYDPYHATYSPDCGRLTLLESGCSEYDYRNARDVMTYDQLGRITSWNSYEWESDDDDDDDDVSPDWESGDDSVSTTRAASGRWKPCELITYTYASDEVYGVTHPMRAVFGMHGPVKEMRSDYYSEYDDSARVTTTACDYDATGRLTAVRVAISNGDKQTVTVDAQGHVTSVAEQYKKTTYTWHGDKIVTAVWGETYPDTTRYEYAADGTSFTQVRNGEKTVYTETPGHRRAARYGSDGRLRDVFVADVQDEDVSFLRPNMLGDLRGFVPDTLVTVSKRGRVVCTVDNCHKPHNGYFSDLMEEPDFELPFDEVWAVNVWTDDYFAVSHKVGETICRDIHDRPVYVVKDGRLVREYTYYEYASISPDDGNYEARTRAAAAANTDDVPEGACYDLLTYNYDREGHVVAMSVKRVDPTSDTPATDPSVELTVEVVYNEALAVPTVPAAPSAPVRMDGRTVSSAAPFDVVDTAGRTVARGVTRFDVPAPGTYIVRSARSAVKVTAR